MFSIDLQCRQDAKEMTIAELWEAGCSGIIERDGEREEDSATARMRVFFDDDALQPELLARFGGEAAPADLRDWVAFAHEFLKPMEFGQRIFVCPEWRDDPTPEGRIRITVNAGLAFGTGAHETTRLCLEAIERNLKPGMIVLDVGTGSGILAEAAAKLGAARVYACDNDPEAVVAARENFEKAGVDVCLSGDPAELYATGLADLVVANISAAWIIDLAPHWVRLLTMDGRAILSGFEAYEVPRVKEALEGAGGVVAGEYAVGEYDANTWRMLEMTRPAQ